MSLGGFLNGTPRDVPIPILLSGPLLRELRSFGCLCSLLAFLGPLLRALRSFSRDFWVLPLSELRPTQAKWEVLGEGSGRWFSFWKNLPLGLPGPKSRVSLHEISSQLGWGERNISFIEWLLNLWFHSKFVVT
jgi:hypothetical protein